MMLPEQPITLLCLSHLRWDHVWQRPQHLMSRFAANCNVIFVDPPELTPGIAHPQLTEQDVQGDVRVLRPLFPESLVTEARASYEALWLELLPDVLALAGKNTILWTSSPHADYLVDAAQHHILFPVYDCMDDLASFRHSDGATRTQEDRLLRLVELVFTGGRSMYEARKDRHPYVHCFPSGVDITHYRQVRDYTLLEPIDVAHLEHPRLGYFGVLDERINWELIAQVAERRPEWHWVLVGPTTKVEASELPTPRNIHYVGQQPYTALPGYLKSFDIATMPFALNEATRFISPTKTLEYLAGDKPVISTSVPDVVATYPGIVTMVDGADAWIHAIEALLAEQTANHAERLERAQPLLAAGSWDGIASQMWTLMEERLVTANATGDEYDGELGVLEPSPSRR